MSEGQHKIKNKRLGRVASSAEPALANLINKIAEAVETLPEDRVFTAGNGIKIVTDNNTTSVGLLRPPSLDLKWYPFKLHKTEGELNVGVFYGSIQNIVPTIKVPDVDGSERDVALDADLFDTDSSQGGSPYVTCADEEGTSIVYIEFTPDDPCTESTDEVKAEIKIAPDNDDEGLPEDTADIGHVMLGKVKVEDVGDGEMAITTINQSVTHSLMHRSCGVSHYFWGV